MHSPQGPKLIIGDAFLGFVSMSRYRRRKQSVGDFVSRYLGLIKLVIISPAIWVSTGT
jgi:hypothetical protein